MRYTVVWTTDAEQELASIWLNAKDRSAVTSAVLRIDMALREDPLLEGESRSGMFRVIHELPLGVDFRAVEEDRMVYVVAVWYVERRT